MTIGDTLKSLTTEHLIRELIRRAANAGGERRASAGDEDLEDVDRAGLLETPTRVYRSWKELYFGYKYREAADFHRLLVTFPEPGADQMVVVSNIRIHSTCEHHLLPFHGRAAVGYIPNGREVVGLSKLSRLVQVYAARFTTQERICQGVTQTLEVCLEDIRGAGCVITATHLCMACRGAKDPDAVTTTSALLGAMRTDPQARAEFLQLSERK